MRTKTRVASLGRVPPSLPWCRRVWRQRVRRPSPRARVRVPPSAGVRPRRCHAARRRDGPCSRLPYPPPPPRWANQPPIDYPFPQARADPGGSPPGPRAARSAGAQAAARFPMDRRRRYRPTACPGRFSLHGGHRAGRAHRSRRKGARAVVPGGAGGPRPRPGTSSCSSATRGWAPAASIR